jgi:signal transduction histidine kinase
MSQRFPLFRIVNNSLRAKITLGVIIPLVMVLGVFTVIEYNRQQEVILSELSSSASRSVRVIENSLRHAMLKSDFSEVQTVLDSINDTEDFSVVYLLDTNGKIIFAPNQEGVGNQLTNTEPGCITCHRLEPDARPGSVIVTAENGGRVFRSMYPIRNSPECSVCHDPKQQTIGLLLTDIPVAPVENALEASFRENLFWWAGMILITALIVNFSMDSLVIQRLKGLARALQSFGQGQHDVRLEEGSSDEIGQLGESFNEMGQRIEIEEIENQRLSTQLRNQNIQRGELLKRLITAQEDERTRVARELHDDLGQALSALSLQVQSLERLINSNPDEAIEQMNQISDLIAETTERMYELMLALRPSVLDEFGLVAALRNHAVRFLEESGIAFELDASGYSGRLTPEIETALYRVFQEALSNVRRHAQAEQVKITLKLQDGVFMGKIQDDGKGFDPQILRRGEDDTRGLGMLSIKERIAQYCGQVEILSQIGEGTTISIQLSTLEENCD